MSTLTLKGGWRVAADLTAGNPSSENPGADAFSVREAFSPEWLLAHGFHRDSDDPDTWRRNKDQRVPANTEGPGLSFDEAVREALTEPGGESRPEGQGQVLGSSVLPGSVSAVPPQAANAEADVIRRGIDSLRWLLNNAHNHNSAHWANFRQGGENDATAALAALDALLAQVAEAGRERDEWCAMHQELARQDFVGRAERAETEAERLDKHMRGLIRAVEAYMRTPHGYMVEKQIHDALALARTALRGGDTG